MDYVREIQIHRHEGDAVKILKLDYLLHSYFNPDNPTRLYYEYEKVYAAITERAAGQWDRTTDVPLEKIPDDGELFAAFPDSIKYDRQKRTLSVRGMMAVDDLRRMLSIGPYAEFWQALFAAWGDANSEPNKATKRNRGVVLTPLERKKTIRRLRRNWETER